MRLGQGEAQQIRALVQVGLEHEAAVELVVAGGKAQLGGEFVELAVKRGRVVGPAPSSSSEAASAAVPSLPGGSRLAPPGNVKRSVTTGIE